MGDERDEDRAPMDRAVMALVSDPSLRPLAIVCLLVLGTFLSGAVLLALSSRNPYAGAALFILVLMTVRLLDEDRRRGALMPSTWAVLALWLTTALISVGMVAAGLF
jgi:hypothetical protein